MLESIKKSPLSSLCEISEEDSGLHFLLKLTTKYSDEELMKKGRKTGLRISFLSQYYYIPSSQCDHTLVVNYSGMDEKEIEEYVKGLLLLLS